MRKHLRMIAGIILHPVRMIEAWYFRSTYQNIIQRHILANWYEKNHERLHKFDGKDFPNTCSFVHSELCGNLYRGAL